MKNIKSLIIAISLLSIAACDWENHFAPIIELDIPKDKPQLVLLCQSLVGSSFIQVSVTKTRSILDTAAYSEIKDSTPYKRFNDTTTYWWYNIKQFDTVRNAQVELFKNDVLIATLKEGNTTGLYSAQLTSPLSSGATYRIRVSAAGYETIEATQIAPTAVKIDTLVIRERVKVNDPDFPVNFSTLDEYAIRFKDLAAEQTCYYALGHARLKTSAREELVPLNFYSYDLLSQNNYLNDNSFNGKETIWRQHTHTWLSGYSQSASEITVFLNLYNYTQDKFRYVQSIERYFDAKDNPFAEPTILYTNVKNGYGIFTMAAVSTDSFKIK